MDLGHLHAHWRWYTHCTIPGPPCFCWQDGDGCPLSRVVCSGTYHTPASTSSLCTHIFKCLPGPNAYNLGNPTLLFVLFPIILFATVSLLKIPPYIVPSWTNSTSHYSESVSLALLSQYPEWNISTEWYKSLEDDGDEVKRRFQQLTRAAVWLYYMEWDLNAARVGEGRKGRNCAHWALATSQYPPKGLPSMLLNSAVIAALEAVNL